jgi:hypothetical protein
MKCIITIQPVGTQRLDIDYSLREQNSVFHLNVVDEHPQVRNVSSPVRDELRCGPRLTRTILHYNNLLSIIFVDSNDKC